MIQNTKYTMISVTTLILLQLATASLASLTSPIKVIRPLNDVHDKCERDVQTFCATNAIDENSELQNLVRRRLAEEEPVKVVKTRTYSFTVGIKFGPKTQPTEPVQQAKNNHRFLNYGPETDTCMWKMFDEQNVSDECVSALMFVNDSVNSPLDRYTDIYENSAVAMSTWTLTISSAGICALLLVCALYTAVTDNEEDDDENEECTDDSDKIAYTAVPLTVV